MIESNFEFLFSQKTLNGWKLIVLNVIEAHQIKSLRLFVLTLLILYSPHTLNSMKFLVESVWKKEARKFNFRDFFTFFFSYLILYGREKESLTPLPFRSSLLHFFKAIFLQRKHEREKKLVRQQSQQLKAYMKFAHNYLRHWYPTFHSHLSLGNVGCRNSIKGRKLYDTLSLYTAQHSTENVRNFSKHCDKS